MRTSVIYLILASLLLLQACDENNYLKDLYVKPMAKFEIPKSEYSVFESVLFTNKGSGQYYTVYPGDKNHCYGIENNTGFATNSYGTFSYSYNDPGIYNAVWIATSINEDGQVEVAIDSTTITVIAKDGGLDNIEISNIYKMDEYSTGGLNIFYTSYGKVVDGDSVLVCPILFPAWKDATFNSIKAKQMMKFELSSSNAKMYWVDQGIEKEIISNVSTYRIVYFVENGQLKTQNFRVKTLSGIVNNYYVAPVMIPLFTSFSINGVNATITRDVSSYTNYDVNITLPSGTDLTNLTPEFVVMNNDVNLLDGTNCKVTFKEIDQVSGQTAVDLSGANLEYHIDYSLMGGNNPKLTQHAVMRIKITKN